MLYVTRRIAYSSGRIKFYDHYGTLLKRLGIFEPVYKKYLRMRRPRDGTGRNERFTAGTEYIKAWSAFARPRRLTRQAARMQ